ncbi:MAG: MotA/TolQ/ExbB proton channel family protein [Burkholderiales bacterium]|nr:MotA/TolQ/ExbB proton channel family protein [Burkholderiales bacterium]
MGFISNFSASFGPIFYLLLIVSIAILTIIIERFLVVFSKKNSLLLSQLNEIFKKIKNNQNISNHIAKENSLGNNVVSIIKNNSKKDAEDELSILLMEKRSSLQRPLEWLNFFAIVSPMLGLLGTIWSMSGSFKELSNSTVSNDMQGMINYLSEAMYATAFGIILSAISMLFLYIFKYKTDSYLMKCELILNKILIKFNFSAT